MFSKELPMKWLGYGIGLLIAGVALFFGLIYAASELGGEVVVLHRKAADGSTTRVRLWIVEDGERTWIEHGAPDAAWMTMLAEDPEITLERHGQVNRYRAHIDPGAHARYHALRREDYGVADQIVAWVSGDVNECEGVPVRIALVQ
jgi:hypothetical protein